MKSFVLYYGVGIYVKNVNNRREEKVICRFFSNLYKFSLGICIIYTKQTKPK